MTDNSGKITLSKSQLIKMFANGEIPKGADFKDLIESMVNKVDDGFDLNTEDGLVLRYKGKLGVQNTEGNTERKESNRFISFYETPNVPNDKIFFSVEKDENNQALILNAGGENKPTASEKDGITPDNNYKNYKGLGLIFFGIVLILIIAIKGIANYDWLIITGSIILIVTGLIIYTMSGKAEPGEPMPGKYDESNDEKKFYFGKDGSMGIGKQSDEHLKLEVNGFTGMVGRIGSYGYEESEGKYKRTVDADSKWHKILYGLKGCTGWEIVAKANGGDYSGNHAILHAIAVSAKGGSKGYRSIRTTSSQCGSFLNKLCLRWVKDSADEYSLEIRTIKNYGQNSNEEKYKIYYRITQLWDDKFMQRSD